MEEPPGLVREVRETILSHDGSRWTDDVRRIRRDDRREFTRRAGMGLIRNMIGNLRVDGFGRRISHGMLFVVLDVELCLVPELVPVELAARLDVGLEDRVLFVELREQRGEGDHPIDAVLVLLGALVVLEG